MADQNPSAPAAKRILDWRRPLLPAVTENLLAFAKTDAILLDHLLVFVPTLHSGRRLRESLALAAAERGRGLLPPEIVTPETFLAQALKNKPVAGETTVVAAWAAVLGDLNHEDFPRCFPRPPGRSTGWRLGMARQLTELRERLGEAGLEFADVAAALGDSSLESERWSELATLESRFHAELGESGLLDPLRTRRTAVETPPLSEGLERIILAATPDPQPLALQSVRRTGKMLPVEVWIYGPEGGEELFDDWGAVRNEAWHNRHFDLEHKKISLHAVSNPEAAADEIAGLSDGKRPDTIALGLADPALNPFVAAALARKEIPHFDPSGETIHNQGPGRLADLLCQAAEDTETATLRNLLQHPDIWQWLRGEVPEDARQGAVLRRLDRLTEDHPDPDLANLLRFCQKDERDETLRHALLRLSKPLEDLQKAPDFPRALASLLRDIHASIPHQPRKEENAQWREQASALRNLLEEADADPITTAKLPRGFARAAFRQRLRKSRVHPDRPPEAHDFLGWLELLWEDAPHLVLAGLNEGRVPESILGDAFLPAAMHTTLGLRDNDDRLARDAYIFESLLQRRTTETAKIEILIPKTASDGSPLKPSRLLFHGPENKLSERIDRIFHEGPENAPPRPRLVPWRLLPPPDLPLPVRLSVTALKDYLRCPFRFFLRHVLGMRPINPIARELGPGPFGTLVHNTLATLRNRKIDTAADAAALLSELKKTAAAQFAATCGDQPSFALRLQEVAFLARIEAFCRIQAGDPHFTAPVEILETEKRFSLHASGCEIRGRIDRIDRKPDGSRELIDYKTGETPVPPDKVHLAGIGGKDPPAHLPGEAFYLENGRTYRWTDLQLPLYVRAEATQDAPNPGVAYFNLAKTFDKSCIERWDTLHPDKLASAWTCAEALIKQIQAGVFWPPNPDIPAAQDDFAALFPDGIEAGVEADAFKNYAFADPPETAGSTPDPAP